MIYGTPEFDLTLVKILKGTKDRKNHAYRHPCYQETCEHAEVMSWHLYGEKPESLLSRTRPREDPEVKQYRLDNYEPTTKSAAEKALNIVSKIFNPNLYSIRWTDESESSKKLKEYTLDYYPEYNSVVNFTKDVLLRKMIADPNGIAAVKLQKVPEKTSEEIKPIISLYGSSAVWNYDVDHFLVFIKEEEEGAGSEKICWYYFEYYDDSNFIEFRAYITSRGELTIEDISRYNHNFGEIPAWKLQGKPEAKDTGEVIYKSFFDAAVPYWNLAITHESDVLGAFINHMHPLRVEASEECNFIWQNQYKCFKGSILMDTGEKMTCPKCDGSGYKSGSPYGVIKVPRPKADEQEGFTPANAVTYVNVPTEPTKLLEDRAARMEKKGMWALNMDVEDEVGENQSGVAKVIDRSAQYDTLYNIGSVVFDTHLQNFFYFTNAYMNGVADKSIGKDAKNNLPQINKPTQFDIASTTELVNNYKVAKESGLDSNYLQIKQIEIQSRDLTTNPDLKKFTTLILDLDPLPGLDQMTISANVSKGFVRNIDAIIHFNIKRFIEKALKEDKNFFEKPKDEQIVKLEEFAKQYETENKPKVTEAMMYASNPVKKGATA
jgi:hypothetical protein